MRGGLVTEKPAGGFAGGAFSVKRDDRAARRAARDGHLLDRVRLRDGLRRPRSETQRRRTSAAAQRTRDCARRGANVLSYAAFIACSLCPSGSRFSALDRSAQSPAPSCTSSLSLSSRIADVDDHAEVLAEVVALREPGRCLVGRLARARRAPCPCASVPTIVSDSSGKASSGSLRRLRSGASLLPRSWSARSCAA